MQSANTAKLDQKIIWVKTFRDDYFSVFELGAIVNFPKYSMERLLLQKKLNASQQISVTHWG